MGRRSSIAIVVLALPALALVGCGARALDPDTGGRGGLGGAGGTGVIDPPSSLLSDFEDIAAATIVHDGYPPRNGYWYTYNDATPCTQVPTPLDATMTYIGQPPPAGTPNPSLGLLALHGSWSGCTTWGAGIGADLNVPVTAGATYLGPKAPYDLTMYTGVTFWAMATPGSDPALRFKLPMRATTRLEDGGICAESETNKCSDDWGEQFTLPANGGWKQFTVRFSDPGFHQEGWGAVFPWNPTDVTSIQIQSVDKGEVYDFWLDDIYLTR